MKIQFQDYFNFSKEFKIIEETPLNSAKQVVLIVLKILSYISMIIPIICAFGLFIQKSNDLSHLTPLKSTSEVAQAEEAQAEEAQAEEAPEAVLAIPAESSEELSQSLSRKSAAAVKIANCFRNYLKTQLIVGKEKLPDILEALRAWKTSSDSKCKAILADSTAELSEKKKGEQIFDYHARLCNTMAFGIGSLIRTPVPGIRVLVSSDENNNPQSIAIYGAIDNHLWYIATHSNNLIHPINKDRIRGSASKIMDLLIRNSNRKKKPIELSSLPLAVSFYEQKGFSKNGDLENDGCTPMIYDPLKALSESI